MLMSKKITASNVKLKRAYERPAAGDGTRILIDRLWPRGVKKVNAAIDQWVKDIAPSTALRKWFDHDPARWQEFRSRYAAEVYEHPEQLKRLRALARQGPITLGAQACLERIVAAVKRCAFIRGSFIASVAGSLTAQDATMHLYI
jgi:uncharacterized protein YeaO (DUF488 family)